MTGRRRQRTGAVTVAELVDRQQSAPAATGSVKTRLSASNDHGGPVTEAEPTADTATDTPERGTSAVARAGRITGLAVGVLAVLAAVTAAWTIEGKQRDQTPVAAPHLEITGVDALRPDRLAAQLDDRNTGSATDRQEHGARPIGSPNTVTPNTTTPNTAIPNTATRRLTGHGSNEWIRSQDAVTSGSATAPKVTDRQQHSPEDVVRRFYRLLTTDSDQAVQLLDPKLTGSDVKALVCSWSDTSKVAVEQVTASGDGTVIAVVRILRPDGSWLRVRQLFGITDGNPPRIGSVRLLSAQRG